MKNGDREGEAPAEPRETSDFPHAHGFFNRLLGFEEPQGWSRRAVERMAPLAMMLDSLVVLWFAREGHRQWRPLVCPWYTTKTAPSFADRLATLRRLSIRQQVLKWATAGPGSRKLLQLLENTVALTT